MLKLSEHFLSQENFLLSKREFARVVMRPLDQAFSITNIKSGFAKCGIHPFKPDAVAKNKMVPSAVHQTTSSTSDTCSDCAPESSASESAMPSSVIPSSSESPSNQISCSRLKVSQKMSVQHLCLHLVFLLQLQLWPHLLLYVTLALMLHQQLLLNLHLPHLFLLLIL